jgi:hypothetical protein
MVQGSKRTFSFASADIALRLKKFHLAGEHRLHTTQQHGLTVASTFPVKHFRYEIGMAYIRRQVQPYFTATSLLHGDARWVHSNALVSFNAPLRVLLSHFAPKIEEHQNCRFPECIP